MIFSISISQVLLLFKCEWLLEVMKLYFTEKVVKPDKNIVNEAILGKVQLL